MRLKNKVEELEKKLKEMHEILDFALEYGKDTIKVWSDVEVSYHFFREYEHYICAKYIKNGKVCEVKKQIPYCIDDERLSVEQNPDGTYFITGKKLEYREEKDVYFQLLKDSEEIIDITEIKEHFENQEKITENLKESAKGLADAVIGLFGKKDTSKTEKVKKPRAKKTEKVDEPKEATKTEKKSKKKGDK